MSGVERHSPRERDDEAVRAKRPDCPIIQTLAIGSSRENASRPALGGATVILVSKKLAKWLSPVKNIEVGDTQNAPDHHQSLKWPGVLPGATPDPPQGRPNGQPAAR